jgi:hypothetical protein
MKPITYSLHFIGQAAEVEGGLRKHAHAPGCSLVTRLTPEGPEAGYVWARPDEDEEALLDSRLAIREDGSLEEEGTVSFARGQTLELRGRGRLGPCPDPHLRQGAVVWEVSGGSGRFERAGGWVTSNLFLSDTGDVTESQLGVVFANGSGCEVGEALPAQVATSGSSSPVETRRISSARDVRSSLR